MFTDDVLLLRKPRLASWVVMFIWFGGTYWTSSVTAQEWESAARMEALVRRLEQTESALAELQQQNRQLYQTLEQISASGPELPVSAQQAPKAAAEEKKSEEKKGEEKKEKKWYDKLSVRGYAQFRYNYLTHLADDSAPPQHAGDSSIERDQEFSIRRARLILFGDVSEHLYVYFQPDFASTPNGSVDSIYFAQIRDWYGDVYLDKEKVHRFRVGQSKIPYGWENLQSSQNRLPLDRDDAFNSAARNERDLGIFYYWTPEWAQETFKVISDENLKGSGNYGVFGFGTYNGQGGSLREFNDELHLISRLTLPLTLPNCQIVEFGIQGYTGSYVVLGAPIAPLGVGPAAIPDGTRNRPGGENGLLDQRLGASFIYYPQPLGFQAEYTTGRGPELNAAQTDVERGSLDGGYAMLFYRYQTPNHGEIWPFARRQYYRGGYKNAPNAPASRIDEWNIGVEWQIRKEIELVCEYLLCDRTNLRPETTGQSYEQFDGEVLRFQFQLNY